MQNNFQPSPNSQTPSQDPLDAAKASELDIDAVQPNMIIAAEVDHGILQSHIKQKSSHKVLLIIVLVVFLVGLLGGAGFAYYYFVARIQDSEYQTVESLSSVLVEDIKATVSIPNILRNHNGIINDGDLKSIADQQVAIKDYKENLDNLKSSVVINHDAVVKQNYDDSRTKVEGYASMTDIADSVEVYLTAGQKINVFMEKTKDSTKISSIADYDIASKDVTQYLDQHLTVPVKDFSDKVFTLERANILAQIADLRTATLAYERYGSASKQYNQSLVKLDQDNKDILSIKGNAQKFDFKGPSDPSIDLLGLKSTVGDRKSIFWR